MRDDVVYRVRDQGDGALRALRALAQVAGFSQHLEAEIPPAGGLIQLPPRLVGLTGGVLC